MGVTASPDWNTLRNKPTVVNSFNGATGAVTGVNSFNGATGAVTGVNSVNGNTGAVTAAQIVAANASIVAGDVGSYGFLGAGSFTSYALNATASGASLRQAGVIGASWSFVGSTVSTGGSGGTPAGTWKCLGNSFSDGISQAGATLWVRIA
jgi:hypothetical protein